MISKMREYSKIFIVIVALAFIGLMVFEWGMDYSGIRSRQNIVGEVDGKELTIQEWQQLYNQLYNMERQRSQEEMSEEKLIQMRDQVWEQYIQRILFKEEMDRLDIVASDSEIVYQIRNYPLEELKKNPAFLTDGVFDWNKYYASFSNPNIPWYDIEMMYRQNLPFQKLQNLIASTIRVSESEIEETYFQENVKAKVAYLGILFSLLSNKIADITDREINLYYQDHLEDFQREERRNLSYVQFELLPSPEDTARLLRQFDEIKERYAAGEDFNKLADLESDDPAVQSNHGRYDFFERGSMVDEFEKAAFGGKVGELVGPIKTAFGYHLILIEDKRMADGKEEVKVSHILKEIRPGVKTRESVENSAYMFKDVASRIGFNTAADSLKLQVLPLNDLVETMPELPVFSRNAQIRSFAFRSKKVNEISDVITTGNGYAVFSITAILNAGPALLEEVRPLVLSRVRLEKSKELAKSYAEHFASRVYQGEPLNLIAESDTAKPKVLRFGETDFISLNSNVPTIGNEYKFNATALSLKEPGDISQLVDTRSGLYWLKLIDTMPFDSTDFKLQKENIRRRLLTQKKNTIFASWYNYLKENASIEDNRRYFDLN
jgi:peptidyl-prolyl cis-trans isomerase D